MGDKINQAQSNSLSGLILDEEDMAFLASLKCDEVNSAGSEPVSQTEPQSSFPNSVSASEYAIRQLYWNDQLSGMPNRALNALRKAGVTTYGELLSIDLGHLPGIGNGTRESLEHFFRACASKNPSLYLQNTTGQQKLLHLTNNRRLVWGPFGQLHILAPKPEAACIDASKLFGELAPIISQDTGEPSLPDAPNNPTAKSDGVPENYTAPIEALDLPETAIRRLKMHGYHSIADVIEASDETLLRMRRVGLLGVKRIREAIEQYVASPNSHPSKAPVDLSPLREDQTPLDNTTLTKATVALLMRHGYQTVGELAAGNQVKLARIPGLGAGKLADIEKALEEALDNLHSPYSDDAIRLAEDAKERLAAADLSIPEPLFQFWAVPIAQKLLDRGTPLASRLIEQLKTVDKPRSSFHEKMLLADWIDQLEQEGREGSLLIDRLSGLTLEQIGSDEGLTRERIRQITKKKLDARPSLVEDKYLPLTNHYEIDRNVFFQIFAEAPVVYEYLKLVKTGGKRLTLEKAIGDQSIDLEQRRAISNYLNSQRIVVGELSIEKRKKPLAQAVFEMLASEHPVDPQDFFDAYQSLLQKHAINNRSLAFSDVASAERFLKRQDYCTVAINGLRYYELDYTQAQRLISGIDFSKYDNCEISTNRILRDYPLLMEELDIHDSYELHTALRNTWDKWEPEELSTCSFGRMPTLSFESGERSGVLRRHQLEDLARELAPVDIDAFCKVYECRYGVSARSIKATIHNDYRTMLKDNFIVLPSNTKLSETAIELIRKAVSRGMRTINDIKQFVAQEENREADKEASSITAPALRRAGFKLSGQCAFLPEENPAAIFGAMMSRDCLDLSVINPDVVKCPAFRTVLNKVHRAHTLIQISRNLYLSGKSLGLFPQDCEDFIDAVRHSPLTTQPFNTKSLRQDGFTHPLLKKGLTDTMGDGLFDTDNHFRKTSANHTQIFRIGQEPIRMPEVIEHLAITYRTRTIDDIMNLLNNRFGAQPKRENVIAWASKCQTYNPETKTFSTSG